MIKRTFHIPARLILLAALILSIPAFYLILTGMTPWQRAAGHALYAIQAMLVAWAILGRGKASAATAHERSNLDGLILLGALASVVPTDTPWPSLEWLLRMAFCGVVFIRLATLLAVYLAPNRLMHVCVLAAFTLMLGGAGFYWLEPDVHSYADGIWLAFTTGATVGYGDLVPTTPASRIFAAFIVLLGYALFSVFTATIAALLVGEDEKRFIKELHGDLRLLRKEITELRGELKQAGALPPADKATSTD